MDNIENLDIYAIYFTNVFNSLTLNREKEIKALKKDKKLFEKILLDILRNDKIIDINSAINLGSYYIHYSGTLNVLKFSRIFGCLDDELNKAIENIIDVIERIIIAESTRKGNLKTAIELLEGKEFIAIPFNNSKNNISINFTSRTD